MRYTLKKRQITKRENQLAEADRIKAAAAAFDTEKRSYHSLASAGVSLSRHMIWAIQFAGCPVLSCPEQNRSDTNTSHSMNQSFL